MTGRVAVLKAYGGDFELREYPVPDPEPGAILIRLTRAGVCGSDLHIWRGEMKEVYGRRTGCSAAATGCASLAPPCR
jgi:D-arabinose 1-dehydrogenase-like Zn-dependent alcohol dehydrogenase